MALKVNQSGVGHRVDLIVAGDPRHELVACEQLAALIVLLGRAGGAR